MAFPNAAQHDVDGRRLPQQRAHANHCLAARGLGYTAMPSNARAGECYRGLSHGFERRRAHLQVDEKGFVEARFHADRDERRPGALAATVNVQHEAFRRRLFFFLVVVLAGHAPVRQAPQPPTLPSHYPPTSGAPERRAHPLSGGHSTR